MFKAGDKLICIDNKNEYLTMYKSYIIIYGYKNKISNKISNDMVIEQILIKNDKGVRGWYFINRFIGLKEYRRNKLEKIRNL